MAATADATARTAVGMPVTTYLPPLYAGQGGLGLAISASAIAQLVLINVIAFFLFGERLSAVQTAGVALGVVSMALMLYPAKGGA